MFFFLSRSLHYICAEPSPHRPSIKTEDQFPKPSSDIFLRSPQLRTFPTEKAENVWSPSTNTTWTVQFPKGPLLLLRQRHAAFDIIPFTVVWADQSHPTQRVCCSNALLQSFLSQLNLHNMFSTYIYHQLPPTCFDVCYTIFRETVNCLNTRRSSQFFYKNKIYSAVTDT